MTHPASASLSRRELIKTGSALGVATAVGALHTGAHAQGAWPQKPVTMVVGYGPGGQTDFAGRVMIQQFQTALGQPVVIDNKAGANGNIGSEDVMRATPDGYRLLVGNGNITLNPHTYKDVKMIDPLRLTPIGLLLQSALVLAVPATSNVKTFKDLADLIKAESASRGGIDFASSGAGALTHVTLELLRERLGGPKINHVPYRGSGPAMTDLIAGRVQAMFDASSVIAPFIKSGQLRPIMVTSAKRVPAFPDVPTAAEVGLRNFEVLSFIGLYGPPGLPADIVAKANAAMNTAMKDPAVVKNITDRGDEPGGGTAAQLDQMTKYYYKTWGDIVKANNIVAS